MILDKYQPVYDDPTPASYVDHVRIDPAIADTEPEVKITKRVLRDWKLILEGSACFRRSRKPASFTVGLFKGELIHLIPGLTHIDGVSIDEPRPTTLSHREGVASSSLHWNIQNSNRRTLDRAGGGKKARYPRFSEIHQLFRYFDENGEEKSFLSHMEDDTMTTFGLATINPDIELGDGCALPSGFKVVIDLRPIIENLKVSFNFIWDKSVYSSVDELLEMRSEDHFIEISNSEKPHFDELSFSPSAFSTALLFHSGFTERTLTMDPRGFTRQFRMARERAGSSSEILPSHHFKRIASIGTDVRNPLFHNGYDPVGVESHRGLIVSYLPEMRAPNRPMPSESDFWVSSEQIRLNKSELVALQKVYESDIIPIHSTAQRLHFGLSYESPTGSEFGELGKDFVVEFLDTSSSIWYELPVDVSDSIHSKNYLSAHVNLPNPITETKIRIRANGKNSFTINKMGLTVE